MEQNNKKQNTEVKQNCEHCKPSVENINNIKYIVKKEPVCSCCGKPESACSSKENNCACEKPLDKQNECLCNEKKGNCECKTGNDNCGCGGKSGGSCCGNHATNKNELKRNIILTGISLVFLILGIINMEKLTGAKFFHYFNFAWGCLIISGTPIIISGVKNIVRGKITSNFLITIAMISSVVLEIIRLCGIEVGGHTSYIVAAGEIAILMSAGGLIEDFIIKRSKKGIERLVNLKPKTAFVKVGNDFVEKNLQDVKIGDVVMIYPNSRVSVDGIVVSGKSSVDASAITGEFVPVDVQENSLVFGGTWNKQGAITVKVSKEPENMTMQKLVKLVEEAEGKKAPISRIADKWASFIVPIAIVSAIIIFFLAKFAFNLTYLNAFIRSVTVLVVFCPCALALATPTAIAAGIGNASYKGIIVKSGEALEIMSKVTDVCFDKTGTLTTGEMKVSKIIPFEVKEKKLLQVLGSTEMLSDHPIAKAIYSYCNAIVKVKKPTESKTLVGSGQSAIIDGNQIDVVTYYKANIKNKEILNQAQLLEKDGNTVIACLSNGVCIGLVCITDTIRKNSNECVRKLENMKLQSSMLTGDNEFVANKVAKECGISHVYSKLMPEEKLSIIKNLQSENKVVCMVGDGVNDAPALATANCSISMGALGNEVAVEASDVAIMTNDINKVSTTLKLSKTVVHTIKRNIFISMGINVLSVVLSLFGLLNPVTGAIVHNISSLFVVISSALILTKKFK